MKRSIFLIFLALLSSTLHASTNVTSPITGNTTWDQAGSPYMIQGKVTVPSGSTLMIEDGVQVIFQGASALEVQGTLRVVGAAAAPTVFNMVEGGLQSELFINGGEAEISDAKVISGVFLVKDSTLTLNGTEITKGSGLYLKGSTTAHLKNNKIYGNAVGIALDGTIKAYLSFNTLVQNTYGLLIKGYSELEASNNSIHDNQMEVVNSTPPFKLGGGGNYWGTEDANAVQAKIQGGVDVKPLRSLKDILRVYVRTQLPLITKKMEIALIAKEKKEAREEAALMKKLKKEQAQVQKPGTAPPAPEAPPAPTAEQAAAPAPEQPAAEQAPAAPEAPEEVEAPEPTNKSIAVKTLPVAPHTLKPLAGLPPEQKVENVTAASATAEAQPATPAAPAPPSTAAGTESVIPPMPEDITAPPAPGTAAAPPPAPETTTPAANAAASTTPPPADMNATAPPPIPDTSAPPPAPAAETAKPAAGETVPAPPDLNEQVPPSAAASSVPPPPAGAANVATTPAAPPPPTDVQPTAEQQKAVSQLGSTSGDIDGMQAPPLDLGPDLSNTTPPTADQLLGTGQPNAPATGTSPAPATGNAVPTNNLTLPPLQDKDVAPPKDLDLPPMDDLGNVNLDSRNK